MDASGYICSERAPDKRGKALAQGLEYERSLPLISIPIQIPSKDRVTWVTEVEVHSGYFTFSQNPEDQVIKTCRTYGVPFQAHTLERVNNDTEGDSFAVQEDFYPVLYKMLRNKQDWKNSVYFRGQATFELGTMEWTESVLKKFAGSLKSAEIFGTVGVSRFPYHYCFEHMESIL
ncbi:hypothetical protein M0R45_008951 [Rubus argutus]|uniref:Uncharacterized protein n=1 Tax=Rubus argutus TaxID=59490 RepID=A0AAW1Y3L0_RUBAR